MYTHGGSALGHEPCTPREGEGGCEVGYRVLWLSSVGRKLVQSGRRHPDRQHAPRSARSRLNVDVAAFWRRRGAGSRLLAECPRMPLAVWPVADQLGHRGVADVRHLRAGPRDYRVPAMLVVR